MSDPRKRHPGHDPSIPPKKIMGVEIRKGTSMAPASMKLSPADLLWNAAKKWSPLGIVAALVIFYYALGGEDGIVRIARALSAEEALLKEVKALRSDIATERNERTKVMSRLHATEKNLSSLCDFVAEMNGGRPNPTWCSADSRSIRVDTVQSPPPFRTTGESWVYVE